MSSANSLMDLIHEAGFTGAGANTMYAIVMAESGGNAGAHNTNAGTGDNSYGLAQINMLGAMGPERLREFGLSSANQLFDPLTNLKVAYKMSGGGTHFGDWSTYNSGAYRQYVGQNTAVVSNIGSGGSGGGAGMTAAVEHTTRDQLMGVDSLGSLLNTVPELNTLVNQAVAGNWTAATFQNKVEDSVWWKTHSDTARSTIIQKANDPAAYEQSWAKVRSSLWDLSHSLGMPLSSDAVSAIATNAMLTGNSTNNAWLTQQISKGENYSKLTSTDGLQGGMAATVQQLTGLSEAYGYQYTPAQLAQYAQGILAGGTTIDTYKQRLEAWAKSAFPGLANDIAAGQTVHDLAAPYMQSMSNLLEVDPGTLNLFTPAIRQALQGTTDPATKQRTTTPLWQFEDQVRQDPRWQYTQNAKDTASTALVKIGRDFGFGF